MVACFSHSTTWDPDTTRGTRIDSAKREDCEMRLRIECRAMVGTMPIPGDCSCVSIASDRRCHSFTSSRLPCSAERSSSLFRKAPPAGRAWTPPSCAVRDSPHIDRRRQKKTVSCPEAVGIDACGGAASACRSASAPFLILFPPHVTHTGPEPVTTTGGAWCRLALPSAPRTPLPDRRRPGCPTARDGYAGRPLDPHPPQALTSTTRWWRCGTKPQPAAAAGRGEAS